MAATTIDLKSEQISAWRRAFLPGNPLRPFLIGMIAFTMLGLFVLLVLLAAPVEGWVVAAVGAGVAALFVSTLILWPFAYATGSRMLAAYRHGFWATWDVGSEEWRTYAKRENRRSIRQTFSTSALILSAVCLGLWIAGIEDAEARELSNWLMGIAAGLVAIGMVAALIVQTRRWSRPTGGRDIQVKFAFEGYIVDGHYTTLRGLGTRLEGVEVQPETLEEPTMLVFRISVPSRYSRQYHTYRVPVPSGKEAEAEVIAERYRSGEL